MSSSVVASAPGKLILMGEHSVVYGRPALVAAMGLRVRVRLAPDPDLDAGEVALRLPDVDCHVTVDRDGIVEYAEAARERWERRRAGDGADEAGRGTEAGPDHVVKVALGEAARLLDAAAAGAGDGGAGLVLEVDSDIPVGCGFGSSAAVGAAVAGAWLAMHGASPSPGEMEELLLEVERRQHGSPSGVDGATVLRGGAVWARPRPGGDGLAVRPVDLDGGHLQRLRVFDTGTPAQGTGAVVAAVRRRWERARRRIEEVLDRMGSATERFRRALGEGDAPAGEVVESIRTFERGLEELGVVPDPVREIVRGVEARGGAAKISGAGALEAPAAGPPSAGALLVYHPRPEAMEGWEPLEGLAAYGVELGVEGYRLERVP